MRVKGEIKIGDYVSIDTKFNSYHGILKHLFEDSVMITKTKRVTTEEHDDGRTVLFTENYSDIRIMIWEIIRIINSKGAYWEL
jgi:hypothetical protein